MERKSQNLEKIPPHKPIFENIDLSQAETWRGKEGDRDFIIERLKTLGLYSQNLIFRGFRLECISLVKKTGVDIATGTGKSFYASTESESVNPTGESALEHALRGNDVIPGCLAVYDKEKFIEKYDYMFTLKAGISYRDALLIVFTLKNKA